MQLIAFQAQPSLQQEGLPYWLFWFLLCIILLLFAFIFLRDKHLRMRLSSFLAGARRRSLLIQLRFKLKKEKQLRGTLLIQLGERAWDEDIPLEGSEDIRAELKELFEKRKASQMEWKKAFSNLERAHKELDESVRRHEAGAQEQKAAKKPFDDLKKQKIGEEKALKGVLKDRERERQVAEIRREIEDIEKRIDGFEDAINEVETEGKIERREYEREIRSLERGKERVQEDIKAIETQQEALYLSLGRLAEERRVVNQGFSGLYSQIDLVNSRIATLQHRIETLSGG